MASSTKDGEVAVFADTNMGTHIAIAVSPDITTSHFKRELERAHLTCFPELGGIKVCNIMVKRKTCFYHLTESLPIKYAFQGFKGRWFLHVEMSPLNGPGKTELFRSQSLVVDSDGRDSDGGNVADSITTATQMNIRVQSGYKKTIGELPINPNRGALKTTSCLKKRRMRKKKVNDLKPLARMDGIQNECSQIIEGCPDVKSLARIVARPKGFSDFSSAGSLDPGSSPIESEPEKQPEAERNDDCLDMQICATPQFSIRTPPRKSPSHFPTYPRLVSSADKLGKATAVGRRILTATYKLRVSENKRRPAIHFYRGALASPPLIQSSVFEISDDDDERSTGIR